MTGSFFFWKERHVPFLPGQTIASALLFSGVRDFGPYSPSTQARYFCGIGACQSCLVVCDGGAPIEACITVASDGMRLRPFMTREEHDDA